MSYTKTNWTNDVTPINASNMNKIENKLENLDTIITNITNSFNNMFTAFNGMWKVKAYDDGSAIRSGYATPSTLSALTVFYEGIEGNRQSTLGDSSSPVQYWEPWGKPNYYTAWYTCYVYADSSKTISSTFYADDQSSIYLNDSQLYTIASCTSTSISLQLNQGWNKIEVIFSEGAGGAGFYFNPRLDQLTNYQIPFKIETI